METVLEIENLHISFHTYAGVVKAVRGVNLQVKKGETLAIVGESGSGKTVTSKAIMKLLPDNIAKIEQGSIHFDGKDLTKLSEREMQHVRGSEISMIFQDPMTALNPTMTVGKQVIEGIIKHQRLGKAEAYKAAENLFELVGIPDAKFRLHQYPHQFSGGMRQRVVIALALACNPKILIADEPTTALDVTIQAQILELLKDIQKKLGTSIILITHDLGVVANMADTVAVMYAGKVVETGTVDEIFYKPQHPYNWGLLSSMPDMDFKGELISIPGSPPDLMNPPAGDAFAARNEFAMKIDYEKEPPMFKVSDTHYAATWLLHPKAPEIKMPDVIKEKQARSVILDESKKVVRDQEVLLQVQDLSKHFTVNNKESLKAVNNISFDIMRGETLGLVGESGCGKSTTGRTIMKLYEATNGEVYYEGKPIQGDLSKKEESQMRRKMQMIFQDPYASLDPRKTVEDTIAEGMDIHGLAKSKEDRKAKVIELLETVGLNKEHAGRYPHEFSGGQRQRIGIARALAVEPEFIIADEPISALDVSIQAQVVNLMKKLQEEKGLTYLFIAHDLSMVKYISDRIGVMYLGNLVELATSDDLYNEPLHPYTQALLSAIPTPDPERERERERTMLEGELPNAINPPVGCAFRTRCPLAMEKCGEVQEWREVREGHWVACHLVTGDEKVAVGDREEGMLMR
ncbi:ABC transporter ATP-binding protein [Sporosarcina sp. Marseille-Q4063]|uniref:ABC transporter ATP-binding protein n=1 Tax=Sporosarcina sp. Marseille-Q4063 TaxID=2810514 RepID=UPI001BAEBBEB|nr:ABC transporter ATP-binding protein [Sporosarcina sp. Marseille-Q4063]QUW21331.1 ABC transporter ATP-binding protein [Sporosarcina sp. Marseille-Q4063]